VSHSLDGGSGEEAVGDHNVDFEDVESDSFENMVEIMNMSKMLNALGNELQRGQFWWYKTSAQTELFQAPKVTQYALLYASLIVILISVLYYQNIFEIHPC